MDVDNTILNNYYDLRLTRNLPYVNPMLLYDIKVKYKLTPRGYYYLKIEILENNCDPREITYIFDHIIQTEIIIKEDGQCIFKSKFGIEDIKFSFSYNRFSKEHAYQLKEFLENIML